MTLDNGTIVKRIVSTNNIDITIPFDCKLYKVNMETYNQQSSSNPNNIISGGYVTDLSAGDTYRVGGGASSLQWLFKES